jgi:type IX secretion system PorP/SprF family membrane protein
MKKLIVLLIVFSFVKAFSQQVPLYSQYMFAKYPYNPAVAGSDDRFIATIGYRNQWMGFEGAPVTGLFTVQGPLGGGSSIGAMVYSDKLGATERMGLMPGYSYRVFLNGDVSLSFGIQAGIIQYVVNGDELTTREAYDPVVPGFKSKALFGDASFGMYLKGKSYYLGISVPQLLNGSVSLNSDFQNIHDGLLQRHLFAMGGVNIEASENLYIEPSILLKSVQAAPIQMDVNCRFVFHNIWWVGASYRTRSAVALLAGFEISDMVFLGYSFDYSTNEISSVSDGSHEVFLGIRFKGKEKSNRFF